MNAKQFFRILFFASAFLIFAPGCTLVRPQYHYPPRTMIIHSNPNGKIPPGQMKKMTGAKSAKHYAPGQNKHYKGKGKKHKKK